ncbi:MULTISPECIES: divergent PAP2 family protein [unclassified Lactococcus]|uniref:divergent PAP2 family protein n=1 Tax=unclassified Lactococcus TaxID=2643510 RepID=UPI0011C9EA31|nr:MULTISPECIES: divergent PAP2 family protein [unclassified Lactococcus]MQW23792.1 divergent PAP2 family protein [Lactococcus sp. dk101]TXK37383.1 divergent PAP2 family protein [Lactococcus sp. dk310]TXK48694.1 divergent PAP2 family protein [Lactococcus sp. dk322]
MIFFTEISQNRVLWTAIVAWALAQAIKILIDCFKTHRINWQLLTATGGMPSSHTSIVVSLAVAIGLRYHFYSPYFAIATVLAFIVMYDAQGIRRQAGQQAHVINVMLENIENTGVKLDKNLKELLGHTPVQVIGGFILGVVVALVMN